jgi:hypothetical protein
MRYLRLATILCFALAAAVDAQDPPAAPGWTCANRPEADYLKEAPLGATRAAKDQLIVNWSKGSLVFRDSGVVAGDEGGTSYTYCGYRAGYHLVRKAEEELYTGVLVAQSSGMLLPAGYEVFMAPSNTEYLAVMQPHGQDGETWAVYSTSGSLLWKGYAGLVGRVRQFTFDMVLGELKDPRWTTSNELSATFMCKGKPSTVSLQRDKSGWNWAPRLECVHAALQAK